MSELTIPIWIITAAISFAGVAIAYSNWQAARHGKSRQDGAESAVVARDLQHIKDTLARIEGGLSSEIRRVEGRVDQVASQSDEAAKVAVIAHESAKSAHKRIDGLERKPKREELG